MRSRLTGILLPATLLLSSFPAISQTGVHDRIAGSVNGGSRVPLSGTISGRAKHANDLGDAPGNQKLDSLSLRFSMTEAQQADLNQLLAAQLNPGTPQYHQWMTPEQFGARFGISSSDMAQVSSWLVSQGFAITEIARSSTFITFTGTVAQAEQAFGTKIHRLSYNGQQHIANVTDPSLPEAVASVVTGITGLNDFRLEPRSRVRNAATSQPLYTQTIDGTTSHYIAPGDLYTIYNFPPSSSGITGSGITVAVMGQTDIELADISAFQTAAGLPIKAPTQKLIGTDPGATALDIDEAHIDLEWSGAAAPGASILYVYGVDVFNNALTYAIDNKVAPIVTVSYGGCETGLGTSFLNSYSQLLQMANAEGITVIGTAGDTGAPDCDSDGLASEGLNVDFPGSSPYAISAGGTMFSGDLSTPGTYWSSTNGSNGSSALAYIPEQPWNETTPSQGLDNGGAAGGGASAFFSKPAWQQGTGAASTPNDGSRDVPDFSLNAAANHDGYVVCTQGSDSTDLPCVSGFLTSSGQPNIFGGTSFVAPTFAGILAMVEQKLGAAAAGGLGNIGPVLYGLASGPTYSSVFHDVVSGNNSVPCSQGTLNCPNGGSIGYTAGTGYDQASGLGSLNVSNLINGWSSAVPIGVGVNVGTGISTTSLTTTNSLCGVSGNLALVATVISAAGGAAPTGTVQFLVDNAIVGTGTLSGGTVSYSLNTGTLTSGGHTLSAVYLGDGNYAGSKGTLLGPNSNSSFYPNGAIASVDVVSASNPDFSLTPCTGAVSVQPGATATGVSFTVTPVNGFTGSVNLTVTNNDGMSATSSFSVTPVTISTSSGVSTSFIVTASAPSTTSSAAASKEFVPRPLQGHSHGAPWYAAGGGTVFASVFLFFYPRRRRWGALLAAVLSVAALTAVGCSNSSTSGGSPSSPSNPLPPATTLVPASPGTYTFTVTAISGTLVHSTQVTVTVP